MNIADMFRTDNPFPSSPAVQLRVLSHHGQAGTLTVAPPASLETRALRSLRPQVSDYLDRVEEATTRGRALAIIGDLGVGKSHLAREVTVEVHNRGGVPLWVLDRPVQDLGSVYRTQLTALYDDRNAKVAFEEVVAGYHAHVTAGAIEDQSMTYLDEATREEFVRQLRLDQLDSQKVVQSFGIDEELIHRHLRAELRSVTGHRQFAVALALLLDRRFNLDVWNWLVGEAPSRALVERGITAPIDGVTGVLDAFTVFGFLHGQLGRPYMMVIDSLEEVLGWEPRERTAFLNGFEGLVNTYVNRGGLLLMCVQPEPWSRLPAGLHERVLQMWPERLDQEETADLVRTYVHRRLERDRPGVEWEPFTDRGLAELAEITNGVPRQILKTCRLAWELMMAPRRPGGLIDETVIHAAVRDLHERRPMPDVRQTVERILATAQWQRESRPQEVVDDDPLLRRVDFWVRVGRHGAIAVVVVPSVLVGAEISDIAAIARTAQAAFPDGGCQILVLVNGLISWRMRDRIAQTTGSAPLLVAEARFDTLLDRALRRLAERLETEQQGGQLGDVWERLQTMSTQQALLLDSVRTLSARLADPASVSRAAVDGRRDALAGPRDTLVGVRLPTAVLDHFARARGALRTLTDAHADIGRMPGAVTPGLASVPEEPWRIAFEPQQLAALGLVAAVQRLLDVFQQGMADWWGSVAERDRATDDGLFSLCRSFEISMETLPLFETAPSGSGGSSEDFAQRTLAAIRRTEAMDTLDTLAESVRAEVLALAGAPVAGGRATPGH